MNSSPENQQFNGEQEEKGVQNFRMFTVSSDPVFIHGLVTDVQVNLYIGNTLSQLSFQN